MVAPRARQRRTSTAPRRLGLILATTLVVTSRERNCSCQSTLVRNPIGEQAMAQVQSQGAEPDHGALSAVIERNIQNQVGLRIRALSRRTFQERMADAMTAFSGSLSFVYLHALWFGVWVLLNSGRFRFRPFDPFPYSLLTLICGSMDGCGKLVDRG